MSELSPNEGEKFDRTNAVLAALVFLGSFIVYALTVQPTFSFWDCGEFIACAYIQGIPHPPGFPLYVMLGRVIALIPFVEDISHRINYLSVISSAVTAMFSYLLAVKIIRYFFPGEEENPLNRLIAYVGGLTGGFFVAFSATNWANSVEAEVYGLALGLSVAIVWLTIKFFENRGTTKAATYLVLAMYLAVLGIGIHMTVYLVVPACAIFFILKKEAGWKDYLIICAFAAIELLMVIIFANGRGGSSAFMALSVLLAMVMVMMLYKRISWGILIAIATTSSLMVSFSSYLWPALPGGVLALVVLAVLSRKYGWNVQWKTAAAILAVGVIGFSVHMWIPIRSAHNPRIDENNPSRNTHTFMRFLDRKQYGQTSMTDRMFQRRGAWSNQFGRHPHMGFWSYFEEQYSKGGWSFAPFFLLGLLGMVVAIGKRLEIGLPFFTLFLICSVGLVLYMNFADGTKYSFETGDAYLEVRNRDYFFTPAFIFFGIAMGLGVAAIMNWIKGLVKDPAPRKALVYASTVLVLLPAVSLANNYHMNDRSKNLLPYIYAKNLLDSVEPNSILFTAGDNDTFPVWCIQEVYNYRKDVRIVNLSLLNTDWYVAQMKNRYDVPISLSDEQILWNPVEVQDRGGTRLSYRPDKPFFDAPRQQMAYLQARPFDGGVVRVQDMMVDEIVIQNKWQVPIFFNAAPYGESPLNLRDHAVHTAQVYKLVRETGQRMVDYEKGYDLYMNVYDFEGLQNSGIYRDENATGVFIGTGLNSLETYSRLLALGDTTRAVALMNRLIDVYPEYWQSHLALSGLATARGDTVEAVRVMRVLEDSLTAFYASNEQNLFYLQDLGLAKTEIARLTGDTELYNEGVDLVWEAFNRDANSSYAYRKLYTVLGQAERYADLRKMALQHAEYRINLQDPSLQRVLNLGGSQSPPPRSGN
ncbi:MAG: DUF2723 domain-containing protein [bacterium]|nr:DUF2723 domain-containing protein [bacterium]